jgi:hypothetical protein
MLSGRKNRSNEAALNGIASQEAGSDSSSSSSSSRRRRRRRKEPRENPQL